MHRSSDRPARQVVGLPLKTGQETRSSALSSTAAAPLSSMMCARSASVSSGLMGTGTRPDRSAAATTAMTWAWRSAASSAGKRCSGSPPRPGRPAQTTGEQTSGCRGGHPPVVISRQHEHGLRLTVKRDRQPASSPGARAGGKDTWNLRPAVRTGTLRVKVVGEDLVPVAFDDPAVAVGAERRVPIRVMHVAGVGEMNAVLEARSGGLDAASPAGSGRRRSSSSPGGTR